MLQLSSLIDNIRLFFLNREQNKYSQNMLTIFFTYDKIIKLKRKKMVK